MFMLVTVIVNMFWLALLLLLLLSLGDFVPGVVWDFKFQIEFWKKINTDTKRLILLLLLLLLLEFCVFAIQKVEIRDLTIKTPNQEEKEKNLLT